MRCALLQINPVIGDIAGNLRRIAGAYEAARTRGARLCITPELALVGYPPRDLLLYPAFVSEAEKALDALARKTLGQNCALILGTVGRSPAGAGKPLRNQAVGLQNGGIVFSYSKRLLPTYDVFDEARYFQAGDRPCVWEFEGLRFALTVCEDIWNDSASCTTPAYPLDPLADLPPFDVLVNLSASPFTVGKQRLREGMLSAIAGKFGVPVLYVNCVGGNDDLVFDGRSMCVGRDGRLSARAEGFAETTLCMDVSAGKDGAAEQAGSFSSVDDFTPEAEIWRALVLGTRDYCFKTGHGSVVLGLSGGIDSALTAAIACAALEPGNVLGVLMPSPYSSGHSLTDALALARNLGMETAVLPIEPVMRTYESVLSQVFQGHGKDVAEENLQARIRGNLLMALSNKFGKILLTTGNKSEISVGYCTIYGDMCGALAVIGDLYKTQVYRLARWFNAYQGGIPDGVLLKAPSAELRPDQTDRDSLPPYEELDAVLRCLIEERLSVEAAASAGHERETVGRIARLVHTAEFKRRQAAPVIKITQQAFGIGWRMPLACAILP
ncbi:MAG: NAD+ synthase [Desulfovibrio sp.]|jgi:NAD+ synthase/NAD+ synthase (glutamine-hydrolysing)|nr:NAD+ synthase [Desulfovibrio sp.]